MEDNSDILIWYVVMDPIYNLWAFDDLRCPAVIAQLYYELEKIYFFYKSYIASDMDSAWWLFFSAMVIYKEGQHHLIVSFSKGKPGLVTAMLNTCLQL